MDFLALVLLATSALQRGCVFPHNANTQYPVSPRALQVPPFPHFPL